MTSSGVKRPLDFGELVNPHLGAAAATIVAASLNQQQCGVPTNTLNSKRRCTNFGDRQEATHQSICSAFRDPAQVLNSLAEDVASMIREELAKKADTCAQANNNSNNSANDTNTVPETPLLTASQTQLICEHLIRDREQKLREEYDKTLINKLAEQYDTFIKCSTAAAAALPQTQNQPHPHLQPPPPPPPPPAPQPPSAPHAPPPSTLPDLSSFAATLSAATNGHPNAALATSHIVYNLQQQAAALQQVHQAAQRINQQQQQHQQRVAPVTSSTLPCGPVLLASSLDEQLATPEALFTLFGVFGDVIRVKILFNKKDNALIQMADANQAQMAQGFLDKQKVFGKVMRVTRSKHQLVQMPREGNQSDAGLTKDFTNSPLHRFKIPGSRNYQNIYPPSNTLHISNIPATTEENDINKAFRDKCGFDCSSFKFFLKNRKMALMKFDTIEQATIALIRMHNFQINEETNLRVSFSKSVN